MMKKKIEAELVSLAHRILLLKNKSDITVLHEEARNLYDKLSVLRFLEAHFDESQPTIGKTQAFEQVETAFETQADEPKIVVGELPSEEELEQEDALAQSELQEKSAQTQDKPEKESSEETQDEEIQDEEKPQDAPPAPEPQEPEQPTPVEEPKESPEPPVVAETPTLSETEHFHQPETIAEVAASQAENPELLSEAVDTLEHGKKEQFTIDPVFKPAFDLEFDAKESEKESDKETPEKDIPAPQFTFDDLLGKDYADPVFVKPEENDRSQTTFTPPTTSNAATSAKPSERNTLNDRLSKGITIGLNDRIAFMKHLFNNSSEDYNRVLSQLMTFDNFDDARAFIDEMVRPDYNNWQGKDEYAERFMEIVQKRFS